MAPENERQCNPEEAINPNLQVIWQPTIDLRFQKKFHPAPELGAGIVRKARILQQKWICLDNGQVEWRDVPEVEGE